MRSHRVKRGGEWGVKPRHAVAVQYVESGVTIVDRELTRAAAGGPTTERHRDPGGGAGHGSRRTQRDGLSGNRQSILDNGEVDGRRDGDSDSLPVS